MQVDPMVSGQRRMARLCTMLWLCIVTAEINTVLGDVGGVLATAPTPPSTNFTTPVDSLQVSHFSGPPREPKCRKTCDTPKECRKTCTPVKCSTCIERPPRHPHPGECRSCPTQKPGCQMLCGIPVQGFGVQGFRVQCYHNCIVGRPPARPPTPNLQEKSPVSAPPVATPPVSSPPASAPKASPPPPAVAETAPSPAPFRSASSPPAPPASQPSSSEDSVAPSPNDSPNGGMRTVSIGVWGSLSLFLAAASPLLFFMGA